MWPLTDKLLGSFPEGTFWSRSCSTDFTHARDSITLHTKDGGKQSLSDLCRQATPSCRLNTFLCNGHLQTAWTLFEDEGPSIHYKRRVFQAEDGNFRGHYAVDFVSLSPYARTGHSRHNECDDPFEDPMGIGHDYLPPRTTYMQNKEFDELGSCDTKPLLIVLHGLAGGSYEHYIRNTIAPLVAPSTQVKQAGLSGGVWEVLVMITRGCAGTKITSPLLFNARATWDLRQTVKWARATWPKRPLFGMGFSLGANILTNYVAEENVNCLFSAVCIASCPFNLDLDSKALQRTWIGKEIYSRYMCKSMMGIFRFHQKIIIENNKSLDISRINNVEYLHQWDREVQCGCWGYPSEDAYYRDASSCDLITSIRTPFFAIHARDDPIAHKEGIPYTELRLNPYTVLCTTANGGHLGWFGVGKSRWYAQSLGMFLNKMLQDIDFEKSAALNVALSNPDTRFHCPPFMFEPLRRRINHNFRK